VADWVLIPCLKALFAELDRIAPGRDKASDGSIGDAAHQAEVSDHNADEVGSVPIHDADKANEVHAIDVDNDLRQADLTMETVVQFLLGRCRSGAEKRLRYVIYNRRIWSASTGWVQKWYSGASPHTEHAHFSASYESAREADTSSWHLEDLVALTNAEIVKIADTVWNRMFESPYDGTKKYAWQYLRYAVSRDTAAAAVEGKLADDFATLGTAVAGVDTAVLSRLADAGRSDEDVADALRVALGDRVTAVAALLAQP
jgi:hypothetical protein